MTELKVPCEVYSRVVGYLRPVSSWNKAKQDEFKARKLFKMPDASQTDARIKSILSTADAPLPVFWLPDDLGGMVNNALQSNS